MIATRHVIFISGPINTGKTTVARALSAVLPRTAHVEVDALRQFVEWMPLEESIPLNLENAARVASAFLERELNVVLTYPLSREEYGFLTDRLRGAAAHHFVSLNPPLAVALTNRGDRELTDWERERIQHHYAVRRNDPGFGIVIDNANQTPDETARAILGQIGLP